MKKIVNFLAIAAIAVFALACQKADDTVSVASVSVQQTLELVEGATGTLSATVLPDNATNKNVSWSSDKESVATVDAGKVTAVAPGTAKITVTTEDGGKTAVCTVTVSAAAVSVSGVSLDKETLTIKPGDSKTLTATVTPADATNKSVTWASDNTAVATVTDGVVTAVADGTAKITVTTVDGNKTAVCEITVTTPPGIAFTSVPEAIDINHTFGLLQMVAWFAWEPVNCSVDEYIFQISATEDFANPVDIDANTLVEYQFDTRTLNYYLYLAGVKPGKAVDVWYRINDKAGNFDYATAKISTKTEFGCFVDPRDNEFYTTVEVGDFTWMCENLRAMTYSDGTALYQSTDGGHVINVFYENGVFGKMAGVYYSFPAAVRDFYDIYWDNDPSAYNASIQVQGVCPDGWHVTAQNDWKYMLDELLALTDEEIPDNFWTTPWVTPTAEAFNKLCNGWEVAFLPDTGTNDLGLYFLPTGYYAQPTSTDVANTEPSAYNFQVHTTCVTMNGYWNAIALAFSPTNSGPATYFSNNNSIHSTWGESRPLRCVKNY